MSSLVLSLDSVSYPFVPGHETVGTVVALGSAVTKWKVGGEIRVVGIYRSRTAN
jgi:D-arabinose 1-dehydrogenase-like Zn-dependent alcohol dehydrogenase